MRVPVETRCNQCGVLKNSKNDYYSRSKSTGVPHQPCKICFKRRMSDQHHAQKHDAMYRQRRAESRGKYQSANALAIRIGQRERKLKSRQALLALYGGACACCAEGRYEFLAIDHTEGGGKRHIASFKNYSAYWRWLLAERRPGFRVLCHNCNMARGFYGYCPHEAEE